MIEIKIVSDEFFKGSVPANYYIDNFNFQGISNGNISGRAFVNDEGFIEMTVFVSSENLVDSNLLIADMTERVVNFKQIFCDRNDAIYLKEFAEYLPSKNYNQEEGYFKLENNSGQMSEQEIIDYVKHKQCGGNCDRRCGIIAL